MGILYGLAPWLAYWVLVGNVPFAASALVALAIAVAALGLGRLTEQPPRTFEIGGVAAFLVLTVLTFATGDSFRERWLLPLSAAAVLAVTAVGVLTGKPFVTEYARAEQSEEAVKRKLLTRIAGLQTWIWVGTFTGMTVSTLVPALARSQTDSATANFFSWIVPFALLAAATIASAVLYDRMTTGIDDLVRETTFVAYDEATIDELYYLAQEHANREVGAGKEAYNVKVGRMGTPLVGDESRMSWPSTYKVRERRH